MKKIDITLLIAALSIAAQVSLAQVVISDDGSQNADPNAVLTLTSDAKGLMLPALSFTNWLNMLPNGGLLTAVTSFDGSRKVLQYHDGEIAGLSGWSPVATSHSSISILKDVLVNDDGTSYFIGRELAVTNAESQFNTVYGKDAGDFGQSESTPAKGNTAVGYQSATFAELPTFSTFIGYQADVSSAAVNAAYSTALGAGAMVTGDHQVVLGTSAETVYIPGLTGTGTEFVKVEADGKLVRSATAPNGPSSNAEIELLKSENELLKARLEKLEAIVEELAKQQ